MRTTLIALALIGSLICAVADLCGLGDGVAFGRLQTVGLFAGLVIAILLPQLRLRDRRHHDEALPGTLGPDRRMRAERRHAA